MEGCVYRALCAGLENARYAHIQRRVGSVSVRERLAARSVRGGVPVLLHRAGFLRGTPEREVHHGDLRACGGDHRRRSVRHMGQLGGTSGVLLGKMGGIKKYNAGNFIISRTLEVFIAYLFSPI